MEAVQSALNDLAGAIASAASRRVVWEASKAAGDPDIFMRSKAHREAEAAVHSCADKAIEAYAQHIRHGVPLGAQQAVQPEPSPLGDPLR